VFIEQINHFTHSLDICHQRNIIETRVKVVRIFAHHFCANNNNRARELLDGQLQKPNYNDIFFPAFFGGISVALGILLCSFLFFPDVNSS